MKTGLYVVGRIKPGPEKALFDHYAARLSRPLDVVEAVENRRLPACEMRASEADLLLAKIPPDSVVLVLDERGHEIDSRGLAVLWRGWQDEGTRHLAIVIGGADGVHDNLKRRADKIISLGRMTWPHMLVRGLVAEQLFRVQCILGNHPYHRD